MRVSYDWLRTYTGDLPPPRRLAELLTMSGSAVESIEEVGGDTCFEIEVTTNRGDCLSHLGLAREAAVVSRSTFHVPEITFEEAPTPVERLTSVDVPATDLCPRYTARVIEDVRVGPSPPWLVRRIESIGLRPVNNVVDVTNFVLFECGQPLHAFDLDRLEGERVVVRRSNAGETITAIDGSRLTLEPDMLVIADASRPVAVAGVMGGLDTEVTEKTTRILVESAEFNALSVRRTSRALKLTSDSSYRFERGIDPLGVGWGSRRAIQLIRQVAGGRIAQGVIDVDFQEHEEPVVSLRLSRVERVLGVAVSGPEVVDILQRLAFGIQDVSGDVVRVHVPSFRPDVTREIDLIEEVARIHGYDRVPARPTMRIMVGRQGERDAIGRRVSDALTGAGLFEAVTFSFVSAEEAALFTAWADREPVMVDDERRGRDNRLRQTLLPSLLTARRTNQDRARADVDLFELASVYLPAEVGPLPREPLHLGLVASGDLRGVKGLVSAAVDAMGVTDPVEWEAWENPFFDAHAAARLVLAGKTLGYAGLVGQPVLERLGLKRPAGAAELDLDVLTARSRAHPHVQPLPEFPAVDRDLNVVVAEDTAWADIEGAVRGAGGGLLEAIEFRETYRGKHVPDGKKSVVFSMILRASDRTLTGEEADAVQTAVVAALQEGLGAELRQA